MTLRDRRVQYETAGLDRADLVADPVRQFTAWYEQAAAAGVAEPNAFTLSSIDHRGVPNGRVVLARGVDERGVTFYTNYASAKESRGGGIGDGCRHVCLVGPASPSAVAWRCGSAERRGE